VATFDTDSTERLPNTVDDEKTHLGCGPTTVL
jgi:hypothetical protein